MELIKEIQETEKPLLEDIEEDDLLEDIEEEGLLSDEVEEESKDKVII